MVDYIVAVTPVPPSLRCFVYEMGHDISTYDQDVGVGEKSLYSGGGDSLDTNTEYQL